jgi:hypothetical protein
VVENAKISKLLLVTSMILVLFGSFNIDNKISSILASFVSLFVIMFKSLDILPNLLSNMFEWLGDRSYSIYLIHMPLIYLLNYSPITNFETFNNFNQILIFGDRGPQHKILFREKLTLYIKFATKVKIDAGYFRINISNDKYRPIATSDTSLCQDGQRNLEIGEHELRLDLNEVNLKPGRYSLDVSLSNASGGPHLGIFKDAIEFEILASPENPIYDYGMQALIDLPSKVIFFR